MSLVWVVVDLIELPQVDNHGLGQGTPVRKAEVQVGWCPAWVAVNNAAHTHFLVLPSPQMLLEGPSETYGLVCVLL